MFRSRVLRPIAGLVLVTFTALTLQPLTAAAQLPSAPKRQAAPSASGEERFSRTLNEIHEILKEVVPQSAMPQRHKAATPATAGKPGEKVLQAVGPKMRLESEQAKPAPGIDLAAKVKVLRAKYKELKSLQTEIDKGFKATEKHIRDKNLPPEILARHEQAVAEYEKRKTEFTVLMDGVEVADDGKGGLAGALTSLGEFMAKYPNEKTHTATDPNNLPWSSPKPVTRAPYTSPSQFKTSRLFGEPVKVAQAGNLSGISLPNTVLPNTPMPADTAPTEDVQITQPIKDLATSLGNNPVKIYNWVRNNIQFIPSYGSIQGSDMTLQTKRGNSFDTASLLVALLRAANVPARYVYGTIEVPADKAMNWVGGVTAPRAAINLMGQGGIPAMGITMGGQVKWVRLEHVWVEAFVDYVPSRGAVNRSPNTWVPLDASFKQYQLTQGMDIGSNVSFDAQAFRAQALQGATVSDADGSVQNINQAAVDQAVFDYQARVRNHATGQTPTPSVSDVIGTQRIIEEARPILLGTLPYTRIATGSRFQTIPDNLRWKFRYDLYASDIDRALENPSITYTRSTPSLAGKKITLSFAPATPADDSTIASFLPQPHPDGTALLPGELPQSLPGYLIRMIPELRVDGQLVATGAEARMGAELIQGAAYFNPGTGQEEAGADNRPTAGDYIVTFLDLQGAGQGQVQSLQARISAARAKIDQFRQNPGDPASLVSMTKEDLTGDVLYGGALGYFAAIDAAAILNGRNSGVVAYRMPSFGNFAIAAQTRFSFGVPRSVAFPGVQMDVDRIVGNEIAKDGNNATVVSFRRAVGAQYSAHEHLVPEQIFTDPNDPNRPQGISAASALAIAASQGQKIHTLGAQNQAIHAQVIASLGIDQSVKEELSNALFVGREVTVHQSNINAFGFTGAGYIILDPDTGAGAYKVSGGANGGNLTGIMTAAAALAIIALLAGKLAFAGLIGGFVLLAAPIYAAIFAFIAVSILIYLTLTDGVDMTCGGQPTCAQIDIILRIATFAVAMALLAAGLSGNLIALLLALVLLRQIMTGR